MKSPKKKYNSFIGTWKLKNKLIIFSECFEFVNMKIW